MFLVLLTIQILWMEDVLIITLSFISAVKLHRCRFVEYSEPERGLDRLHPIFTICYRRVQFQVVDDYFSSNFAIFAVP